MSARKDFANQYDGSEAWRRDAECRDAPSDSLWFPDESMMRPAIAEAKILCGGCPVRNACLEYALAMDSRNDQFGIWAATTPEQRRRMRRSIVRKSRRQAAGAA